MRHSISVDVEEYFHANNLERVAPPARWFTLQSRVVRSTEQILELFEQHQVKSTFFILGYVARRHPELVRKISSAGHEIASHGYGHRLAFTQTPKQFSRDVKRAKLLLEDISGKAVLGYRAPSFSIRQDNLWAYDSLIDAGYIYDSSLFPIRHPRYGNRHQGTGPAALERDSGTLFLMPLAVHAVSFLGCEMRFPAAGGAYWRLLPQNYISWALSGIADRSRRDPGAPGFNCYFHPWELDPDQPVFSQLSFLTKLRHYGGAKMFAGKIDYFLRKFSFTTIADAAGDTFGKEFDDARVRSSERKA